MLLEKITSTFKQPCRNKDDLRKEKTLSDTGDPRSARTDMWVEKNHDGEPIVPPGQHVGSKQHVVRKNHINIQTTPSQYARFAERKSLSDTGDPRSVRTDMWVEIKWE
jgi:hypothetical protein